MLSAVGNRAALLIVASAAVIGFSAAFAQERSALPAEMDGHTFTLPVSQHLSVQTTEPRAVAFLRFGPNAKERARAFRQIEMLLQAKDRVSLVWVSYDKFTRPCEAMGVLADLCELATDGMSGNRTTLFRLQPAGPATGGRYLVPEAAAVKSVEGPVTTLVDGSLYINLGSTNAPKAVHCLPPIIELYLCTHVGAVGSAISYTVKFVVPVTPLPLDRIMAFVSTAENTVRELLNE
jgi:hypothetical protein